MNKIINININTPSILPLSCMRYLFLSVEFPFNVLMDLSSERTKEDFCLKKYFKKLLLPENTIVFWLKKNLYIDAYPAIIENIQKSMVIRRHCYPTRFLPLSHKNSLYHFLNLLIEEYVEFTLFLYENKTKYDILTLIKIFYSKQYEIFEKKNLNDSELNFTHNINVLIYYNYVLLESFHKCNCMNNNIMDNIIVIPFINDELFIINNSIIEIDDLLLYNDNKKK